MKKSQPSFSLKDQLFNKEKVEYLSGLIKNVYSDFLYLEFNKEVLIKFPELELKQRISHISDLFKKYLPNDFEKAVNIMINSLPELADNGTLDNNSHLLKTFQKYLIIFSYIERKTTLQADTKTPTNEVFFDDFS
ncbi:MAG: hypothetical protein Q9M97_09695 [Candidatus Gracilibacteria bacterium]|nr:hypothetical protein [Candidatus Gracilibacteria bacterium]